MHPSKTPAPALVDLSTGPQQPPTTTASDHSGEPPTGNRNRRSDQHPPGAAEGAEQPGSLLAADPLGHVAMQMEEAAAALAEDMITGILGRGALGLVFEAR